MVERTPRRKFNQRTAGGKREEDPFEDAIVQINRVSKKTKGGNKIGFSVLVVSGDRKGKVGVGLGKAPDVASAIRKGAKRSRKNMVVVPITDNHSVPEDIFIKKGASKVLLKPAPAGSGIIAGGAVRSVVSLAGIKNISSKILGTTNKASNVYATLEALRQLSFRSAGRLALAERKKKATSKRKKQAGKKRVKRKKDA